MPKISKNEMPLFINICCICLKPNCITVLTQNDSNNVSIVAKLRSIVPEVEWNPNAKICLQCLELVDNFTNFKKLCLDSNSSQKTVKNECDDVKIEHSSPGKHTLPNLSFGIESDSKDIWDTWGQQSSSDSCNNDTQFKQNIRKKRTAKKTDHKAYESKTINLTQKPAKRKRFTCLPCGRSIVSETKFKQHKKTCFGILEPPQTNSKFDQSSHACDRCARRFTSKQVLNAHATTACCGVTSESEVRTKCPLCLRVFGNKNALKVHFKSIHNVNLDDVNMCQVCFAQFSNAQDLSAHVHTREEVAEVTLHMSRCSECEETFTSTDDLSQHIYTQHDLIWEGEASCEVCHEVFTSGKDATSHYASAHGIKEPSLVRPYLCPHCPGRYRVSTIKPHIKGHFVDKLSQIEVKYRCDGCGEMFLHARPLEIHFSSQHAIGKESVHPYSCRHCSAKSTSLGGLFKHVRSHHLSPGNEVPNAENPLLSCEVCNATFTNVHDVTQHCKSLHNLKNPTLYACPHCPRRFCALETCAEHISKYFQSEEPQHFVCVTCGASFKAKHSLKVHEDSQHLNIEYICDRCGKKFKKKQSLRSHNRIWHPDVVPVDKLIKCSHCDKTFGSNSDLKQHLNAVNGIKKHECQTCGKKFVILANLKRHSRIHSEDPASKFECPECHKLFNFKQYLGQHMKKEHNLGNARIIPRSQRKRNFLCNLCPKNFYEKRALQKHLYSHAGIKPYPCHICNRSFTGKHYVKLHMLKEHNFKP